MRLGSAGIGVVSDGVFRVDGGAVFGVAPKAIWSGLLVFGHGVEPLAVRLNRNDAGRLTPAPDKID